MMSTVAWMSVAFAWMAAQQTPPPAPAPSPLPEPARIEEPLAPTVHVTGTAVALDDKGVEHAHEDGLIRALQWPAGVIEIPVHDGRIEADVRADAKITNASLTLGGRSVTFTNRSISTDSGAPIALRGEWIGDFVLHVVDATTHAELRECEWVFGPGSSDPVDLEASRKREGWSAKEVDSPLRFAREGRYWVRAPGHAWQVQRCFNGRPQFTAEETLELPAACSLVVELPERIDRARRWLGFESADGADWLTIDAPDPGERRIDSLPPGDVKLRTLLNFNFKPWIWHVVPLASATATLRPDAVAKLTLPHESKPAGLHEDGTVDRLAVVSIAGAKRDDARGRTGSIEFSYYARLGASELLHFTAKSWSIGELTRDGLDVARTHECDVEDGRAKLRPPFGCILSISNVVLDGKRYYLPADGLGLDTISDPIEIVIPDPGVVAGPPLTLHVREKGTAGELDHVFVARRNLEHFAMGDSGFSVHPGHFAKDDLELADGVSPVVLRDPTGRRSVETLFVRADGFAWTRTDCDWKKGGEQVIELERACDLTVTLDPPIDATGLRLSVYRAGDRDALIAKLREWMQELDADAPDQQRPETREEFLQEIEALQRPDPAEAIARLSGTPLLRIGVDPSGITAIDGLPRALLDVVITNEVEQHHALGAVLVDARDGGRQTAVVRLKGDALGERVPMAGSVVVPCEWGDGDWTLRAEPAGKLQSTVQGVVSPRLKYLAEEKAKGREYSFDAGSVMPGTYRFSLSPAAIGASVSAYSVRIELGANGDRNLRIEIPPPSDVRVEVVDAATGGPAAIGRTSCFVDELTEDHGHSGRRLFGMEPGAKGVLRFRAPAGPFRLRIEDDRYARVDQLFELAAGESRLTVRLTRACGVHLHLLDGALPIAWDDDIEVTPKSIGADGTTTGIGAFPSYGASVKLTEPGRYRLEFDTDDDSTSIAPIEVTVPAGEFVDVNVRLEKRS